MIMTIMTIIHPDNGGSHCPHRGHPPPHHGEAVGPAIILWFLTTSFFILIFKVIILTKTIINTWRPGIIINIMTIITIITWCSGIMTIIVINIMTIITITWPDVQASWQQVVAETGNPDRLLDHLHQPSGCRVVVILIIKMIICFLWSLIICFWRILLKYEIDLPPAHLLVCELEMWIDPPLPWSLP